MRNDLTLIHDPAIPIDAFVTLAARHNARKVALSAAAIDGFGLIRLRTLLEREGVTAVIVYDSSASTRGEPTGIGISERTTFIAGALDARAASGASLARCPTIDAETLEAHGDSLAIAAQASSAGETVLLARSGWARMAGTV